MKGVICIIGVTLFNFSPRVHGEIRASRITLPKNCIDSPQSAELSFGCNVGTELESDEASLSFCTGRDDRAWFAYDVDSFKTEEKAVFDGNYPIKSSREIYVDNTTSCSIVGLAETCQSKILEEMDCSAGSCSVIIPPELETNTKLVLATKCDKEHLKDVRITVREEISKVKLQTIPSNLVFHYHIEPTDSYGYDPKPCPIEKVIAKECSNVYETFAQLHDSCDVVKEDDTIESKGPCAYNLVATAHINDLTNCSYEEPDLLIRQDLFHDRLAVFYDSHFNDFVLDSIRFVGQANSTKCKTIQWANVEELNDIEVKGHCVNTAKNHKFWFEEAANKANLLVEGNDLIADFDLSKRSKFGWGGIFSPRPLDSSRPCYLDFQKEIVIRLIKYRSSKGL